MAKTKIEPIVSTRKRPDTKQWAEAEALWASGEIKQADLAARLGVSEVAVSRHMKLKGVKRNSLAHRHAKAVIEEVERQAVSEVSVIAARVRETKDEHYKMATGLAKLAWAEVLKAKNDGAPISTATNNLKAIDTAMNVLSKARQERWAVLGLDKVAPDAEEGLPQLLVSELTAEQIQELRDRDFNEFEDVDEQIDEISGENARKAREEEGSDDEDVVDEE